jgi:methionine-rich copper-binding protein CopC
MTSSHPGRNAGLPVAPLGQRRAVLLLAATLAAALLGWTPAQPAGAHGQLVSSQPAADGLVEVMPSRAFLTFSAPVKEVKEIAVVGPDGSVANGTATANGTEVTQTLWSGPAGDYTMSYFVVSEDGHDVRGDVRFQVGELSVLATGADQAPAPARSAAEPEDDGPGIAIPAVVLLLSVAVALVLGRRRATRSG